MINKAVKVKCVIAVIYACEEQLNLWLLSSQMRLDAALVNKLVPYAWLLPVM